MCCNYLPVVSRKMLQFEAKLPQHSFLSVPHKLLWAQFHRFEPDRIVTPRCSKPVDQRKLVSAAAWSHLPPVTLRTDNNRRVLILFQLSRGALQSAAYQSGDKEQRRKSCGRASPWFKVSHTTPVQWCLTPPPCWWPPFPSANKSAPSQPTRTCWIKPGFF